MMNLGGWGIGHKKADGPGLMMPVLKSSKSRFNANQLKFFKEIHNLRKKNPSCAQAALHHFFLDKNTPDIDFHKHSRSNVKLPPLAAISHRPSIDLQSLIPAPPVLASINSTKVLHREPTIRPKRLSKKLSKKSTITNRIPSQIRNCVSKYSAFSQTGSIMHIPKPHNQDSFLVKTNFGNVKGQYLFAVCDGHGEIGHDVSSYITSHLGSALERSLSSSDLDLDCIAEQIKCAVQETNSNLLKSSIDCKFSGSTLVSILLMGNKLFAANVGDSRAVLGSFRGKWESTDLTHDHKPERSDELKRVLSCGGRVEALNGQGALRVWHKHHFRGRNQRAAAERARQAAHPGLRRRVGLHPFQRGRRNRRLSPAQRQLRGRFCGPSRRGRVPLAEVF
jgi:hypothetical protein